MESIAEIHNKAYNDPKLMEKIIDNSIAKFTVEQKIEQLLKEKQTIDI